MASAQCQKPSHEQNMKQTNHQKITSNQTNNTDHHRFSNKMKEMAQSVGKMFHHQDQQHPNHHTAPAKPANSCSTTAHHGHRIKKTNEGQEGHCMPKMRDRIRNMKKKKMHEKEKYSDRESSSSDSDNENR